MAKQSSVNLDITNNADGFDISGGTTVRKLGITGGDVTIAGSGSAVVTFPTTSTTIAGLGITQSFSALQSFSAGISASGGVTLAGSLQGTTSSFTGLVSSTVGFSGPGTNISGIVTSFNNQTGAVTGVTVGGTNVFTSLNSFTAGISAAGGVTLAGTLQGTTATFSGDIAVNGGDITTTSTTATLFNANATTLDIANTQSSGLTLNIANSTSFGGNKIINIGRNNSGGAITTLIVGQNSNDKISLLGGVTIGVSPGSQTNIVGGSLIVNPESTFNFLARFTAGLSASGITVGRIVSGGTSGINLEPGSGLLNVIGGISASGGFTFGSLSGTTWIAFVPQTSCSSGGLWIRDGNLQLSGSALGSGQGTFSYSPCGEQFVVTGYSTFQNSYNYQSGRSPLRLNSAPTQSVPILAAYKQTSEGTQLTNTFTTTNMVAGIDQNGALFSSVGISAAGGVTFVNDIRVNSMTIGRGTANIATNIAFGASAYFSGTTGYNNVAIGSNALRLNQAGDVNTAIGAGALQSNVNGRNNVAIGANALNTLNTTTWSTASQAEYNVAIGGNALGNATTASNNIGIGAAAAQNITTGGGNVSIGTYTALKNGSGGDNVSIGNQAMVGSGSLTSQNYNTSIGANSMFSIANANYNTAIGHSALFTSTTGQYNTIIGAYALYYATAPTSSVALGYEAGRFAGITGGSNLTSSTNSVYIGSGSKSGFTTSSNEIVIGVNAVGLGSNTTVLGTSSTTSTTIYGTLNLPSGISCSGGITFANNVQANGYILTSNARSWFL